MLANNTNSRHFIFLIRSFNSDVRAHLGLTGSYKLV